MNKGILSTARIATVSLLVAVAVGLAVPSPSGSVDGAHPRASHEVFTGSVADFYQVPDPLPPGAPGELIRVQTVATTADMTTVRIMYHSVDGAGRDRAVTGKLTFPNAPAPAEGWPVMSIANGTVGLAPHCAPSRSGGSVYDFGIGGVAVASDYIGEGPVGEVQAYLSRVSEGHSVIDAVRAARNYADAHAGSRFVVLGGSQGGHGALSASELATTWAPELELLGTVSLAPAAMFDRTYGPLDELVTLVVTAMGTVGLSTEHPEIDLADYAGPAGLAAFEKMKGECRDQIILTVLGVEGGIFTNDPRDTEPARSIMLANDVGHVAAPSPVLLVQGTADNYVHPLRTDDLFARMCDAGQVTEYLVVDGADHGNVTGMAITEIEAWLAARYAGDAAPNTCPEPPPDSTSTVPPTTTPPTTTPGSTTPATDPGGTSVPTTGNPAPSTTTRPLPTAPVTSAPIGPLPSGPSTSSTPDASTAVGATGIRHDRHRPDARRHRGTGRSGDGALAATGSDVLALGAAGLVGMAVGVILIAAQRRSLSRRR